MPRAIDPSLPAGGLPIDHSPLNRLQFNVIPQDFDLAEFLEQLVVNMVDLIETQLFPAIEELTGIDLSAFLPLLHLLELDFSTPESFLTSLWAAMLAMPGAVIEVITRIINQGGLFDLLPLSSIGNFIPNLLMLPKFDSVNWIPTDILDWVWDALTFPLAGFGSVSVLADGAHHGLPAPNLINVIPGQQVIMSVKTMWEGLVGTGSPIRLGLIENPGESTPGPGMGTEFPSTFPFSFPLRGAGPTPAALPTTLPFALGGIGGGAGGSTSGVILDSTGAPGDSGWTTMSGTYTVPAGVTAVKMLLQLADTATAGQVWFSDGSITKPLLPSTAPIDWITNLPESLADLFGRIKDTIDTILQALLQFTGIDFDNFEDLLSSLFDALQNIPGLNILGHGGPLNIIDTIQDTWDNWIGGLVDAIGSGAGLADLFNVGRQVSSNSTLGAFSWDILGIRNNKPLWGGLLPTGVSNIPLPLHQPTAPTFPLTQSTATMAFHHIDEGSDKSVVSWMGSGITSITDFYINIYRMATDGALTLVHQSANIIGDVSAALGVNIYELPTPLNVAAGETYGIELATRGAGTHNIVGVQTWMPNHPTVFPRNLAAVRNSGTSAPPSTIASGSVTPSTNVPFVEFAVTAGDFNNHEPLLRQFLTAGSTTLNAPSWANLIEVIVLGGGGGGRAGGVGSDGRGGSGGNWTTTTWVKGTDFTTPPTISITVASGGIGGAGTGAPGGNSTVSITGHTVTATGGAGGTTGTILGDHSGHGPGNQSYGGQLYVGGGSASGFGNNGAAPGGGGAGGSGSTLSGGGNGAPAAVWIRFKS